MKESDLFTRYKDVVFDGTSSSVFFLFTLCNDFIFTHLTCSSFFYN